jgi:MFS transporter, PAT family, beta-lactamase induction signal transducer AmpG
VALMFFFILTYRLGEAQLSKIASPFLLDTLENGGLNMSTSTYGLIYGTFGVAALLLGGIIGGVLISRHGLKRWIIPMALLINLPDIFYVFLAYYQPSVSMAAIFVVLEQFGYGFGFTAYMLYLINIADGEYKTAHYAIATGFMALGMMLPSMVSGWIQEQLGYTLFFIWVCICTIPSIFAAVFVRAKLDPFYGKK